MNDGQELDTASFNKNYQILKEIADWLSERQEPHIDELVPKVERVIKSYGICQDRLTKV